MNLSNITATVSLDLGDFFEIRNGKQVLTSHTFLLEGEVGFFNPDPEHTYTVLETTFGVGIGDDQIIYIFTHKLRRVL